MKNRMNLFKALLPALILSGTFSSTLASAVVRFENNTLILPYVVAGNDLYNVNLKLIENSNPIELTLGPYYKYIEYGHFGTSILHLMAITINRYIMVCHPGAYNRIYCSRNVYIMIGIMWLFNFGIGLLPLFAIWGQIGSKILLD